MDHDGGISPARCNGYHEGYVWDMDWIKGARWVMLSWTFAFVGLYPSFGSLVLATDKPIQKSSAFASLSGYLLPSKVDLLFYQVLSW
jgi:hypothetical protein